jgi:hypothetical protein
MPTGPQSTYSYPLSPPRPLEAKKKGRTEVLPDALVDNVDVSAPRVIAPEVAAMLEHITEGLALRDDVDAKL